jgi:hypothetical protein
MLILHELFQELFGNFRAVTRRHGNSHTSATSATGFLWLAWLDQFVETVEGTDKDWDPYKVALKARAERVDSAIPAPSGKALLVSNLDRRRKRREPNTFVE